MRRAIAGIDIGSTKVAVLVGLADEGVLRVVGAGVVPCDGVEGGMIADLEAVTECVSRATDLAEQSSGCRIDEAFVSVGGDQILSVNSSGEASVGHPMRGVEQDDVDRALAGATNMSLPSEREILHIIPRGFWLDGNVPVRDPLGMSAYRIGAEVHIVTALSSSLRNVSRCVQEAGIRVAGLVAQPLASGEAVLTESEKEMGVALVDIGGGTSDVAVYLDGSVWHTASVRMGGRSITNDLAIGLHCPYEVAEDIKLRFGESAMAEIAEDSPIRIAGFGANPGRETTRREVVQIIGARVEEIFRHVLRELRRSAYDGLLSAGVVLSGGGANLPRVTALAESVLALPVRVGTPRQVEGLAGIVDNTDCATGIGLLLWGANQPASDAEDSRTFWQKMGQIVRNILPG